MFDLNVKKLEELLLRQTVAQEKIAASLASINAKLAAPGDTTLTVDRSKG